MIRNLLELAGGTQIASGAEGAALMNVKLTQNVNQGQDLTLGSVCAAVLEATLLNVLPGQIQAGDTLTLYTVDDRGNTTQQGVFIAEKPEYTGSHTMRLTAWDKVTLLDKDLTDWLSGLQQWPYSLYQLTELVCSRCDIQWHAGELPNGELQVQKFTARGITGRQLICWIAEAAGRFAFANRLGQLEFGWYTPTDIQIGVTEIPAAASCYAQGDLQLELYGAEVTDAVSVTSAHLSAQDDGAGNVTVQLSSGLGQHGCLQGKLQLSDYAVASIQKVQLRADEQDVGTVYPADTDDAVNTYTITGNPLLAAVDAQALQPVAQVLYEQLRQVSYTPCTLGLPATTRIRPGHTVTVTDSHGSRFTAYIMSAERSGQLLTLTCAGTPNRQSTRAANDITKTDQPGKVLRLRTDVDGLLAENADTAGRLARLSMDVNGIQSQVQHQQQAADGVQTQLSRLEQTTGELSATVQSITDDGVNKVTTAFGLRVDGSAVTIARSGSNMENKLSEKGMYVVRDAGAGNETVMLRADADGVLATDVSVRNYLLVGDHARFEDYTDGADTRRTACFFIGG